MTSSETQARPLAGLVRSFYKDRATLPPTELRSWLAPNVRWFEPTVGSHMGFLNGADSVISMMLAALAKTDGSFRLEVEKIIETGNHCSATISWRAEKNGHTIHGEELAVFTFLEGAIVEAHFFASDLANDHDFWA